MYRSVQCRLAQICALSLAAGVFVLVGPVARGQSTESSHTAAVYRYVSPGHSAIAIDVWGDVRHPGRYYVEPGSDLLDVLTLAGGPLVGTGGTRVRRHVSIRLTRGDGTDRRIEYESPVAGLEVGQIPGVSDGDLITVQSWQRERFIWRDVLTTTSALASLGLLILRIVERS